MTKIHDSEENQNLIQIRIDPKTENSTDDNIPVVICGISLQSLGRTGQFLVTSFGILFFFIVYGYLQEKLFSYGDFKPYIWQLTFLQFFYYALCAFIETKLFKKSERRIPMKTYVLIAFITVTTMGCANKSLSYMNYPTQVIFKCCNLIPVMIGGMLIQKKVYNRFDFLAVILMTIGLIFFTLGDSESSPDFNMTGILLIVLSLAADAVIGNVQEKAMKQYGANQVEMVLYSYSLGTVYLFFGQVASGNFMPATRYFNEHPEVYFLQFTFSFFGYVGVQFVLSMVKAYGALPTVTVTALRKVLTITLSFIFFAKPFTIQYVWSGLLVLLGISFNIYSKNRANLIETGRLVYCHGFMSAQAICILSIIFIAINASVPETSPILVEQRFNSSRLE